MKLLQTDKSSGYSNIRIESDDDLWRLKDFIKEGDEVRAVTQRTKLDGREKKTCKLKLRAEKTDYTGDRLRITGQITEGAEDVELGYHTFNLEEGKEFELWKEFTQQDWDKLRDWEKKRSYQVLFCLVEKGSADLYMVEESGIKDLSKVKQNIPGKMYSDQKTGEEFHKEVRSVLERSAKEIESLVLAGPGNQKKKVYNTLSEEIKDKTFLQDTSVTGETGLHESIKRGALEKVVEDSRIGEETSAMEKLFEELEKDGNASYGDPVKEIVEKGAVEKLFLTPEKNRQNPKIKQKVERQGGETVLIHTDHEAGERLKSLGGIAALLRYKVN